MRLKTKYLNLASTTTLTTVENKISNVSNLIKKLTITQKLVKLKIKLLLILIMINSDFGDKLKNVTSNKNELNELSKKFKKYQQKD